MASSKKRNSSRKNKKTSIDKKALIDDSLLDFPLALASDLAAPCVSSTASSSSSQLPLAENFTISSSANAGNNVLPATHTSHELEHCATTSAQSGKLVISAPKPETLSQNLLTLESSKPGKNSPTTINMASDSPADRLTEDAIKSSQKWYSVFGCKTGLSFITPSAYSDHEVTVTPAINAYDEGLTRWQNCLIGQFVGNCPNFSLIQRVAFLIWGKRGLIRVTLVEHNLYLFQFKEPNARDWVLESGPWHIKNNTLILRKWESGLKSLKLPENKFPAWIRLHGIPLE